MVGTEFIDFITKYKVTSYAGLEDFADKFNFIFTVLVLSLCTLIITTKTYVFKPIACYISTEVGGSNLLNYVENYCWVQGTIPVSYSGKMPSTEDEWNAIEEKKILYYQWVPFVLGLQCCMFYLPRVIWQAICYNRTGTDLENLIKQAMDAVHSTEDSRKKAVDNIAADIEYLLFQEQKRAGISKSSSIFARQKSINLEGVRMLNVSGESQHDAPRSSSALRGVRLPLLSKRRGTYIVAAYLFIKVLYLLNAIGQIFLMQRFIGFNTTKNPIFGVSVLRDIIAGHDWQVTQIFPRVGFCFAQMKILGVQSNGVTAQCALPVNMLNEKLYIFLWWWITFAALITAVYLGLWIFRFCMRSREADYIIKYIKLTDDIMSFDERDAYDFASKFLRHDGMFLVRMVRMNAGDVIAAAVVNSLWDRYMHRLNEKIRDPLNNYMIPAVGWSADLEKGGEDTAVRNRDCRVDNPKEALYPAAPLLVPDQPRSVV